MLDPNIQYSTTLIPTTNRYKQSPQLLTTIFNQSQLIQNIISKHKKQVLSTSLKTNQHRRSYEKNCQAQSHDLTKIITKIYTDPSSQYINRLYEQKKSKNHKNTYSQKVKNDQTFIHPKKLVNNNKISKTKKKYISTYQKLLTQSCKQHQNSNKPLESKLCLNNYLYSQLSMSGLASRKFNSVSSGRKVSCIKTDSADFPQYPLSPKLVEQLRQIQRKRKSSRQIKKYKGKDNNYWQRFVFDNGVSLKNYLRDIKQLQRNKQKIYKSRFEQIQLLENMVQGQGWDFYERFNEVMDRQKSKDIKKEIEIRLQVKKDRLKRFENRRWPVGKMCMK